MAKIAVRSADTPEAVKILDSDEMLVGRGSDCQIVLADGCVSRQHCLLRRTPEGFRVYARSSSNPTIVNGMLVGQEVLLQTGDIIRVGNTDLLYVTDPREFQAVQPDSAAPVSEEISTAQTLDDIGLAPPPPLPDDECPFGKDPLAALSMEEVEELRRQLPAKTDTVAKTRKIKPPVPVINKEQVARHVAAMKQRKRNDFNAKLIVFLIFGLPSIIVQGLIIWYFFLREG